MYLGSPSSSVVPDSEIDDDSFLIFYSPPAEILKETNMRHGTVIPYNNANASETHDGGETAGLSQALTGVRSLRKRKAIQKMPYSLERIKHQQLLKGYDMTSFEDNCEQLILPAKPLVKETQDLLIWHNDNNDWTGLEGPESSENSSLLGEFNHSSTAIGDVTEADVSGDAQGNAIQEVQAEHSVSFDDENKNTTELAEDQMMFRGKLLNMKTAYRGILPRVAWKKSLSKQDNGKSQKRRKSIIDQKGVAKKRLMPNRNNQDDSLMNDLIASDEDLIIQEENIYNIKHNNDTQSLIALNEYYQGRYMNDYLSDDSNGRNDDFDRENLVIDLENDDEILNERLLYEASPKFDHEPSDSFNFTRTATTSFNHDREDMASENNVKAINYMLSEPIKKYSKAGDATKTQGIKQTRLSIYRHASRGTGPSHTIQRSKRKLRDHNIANRSRTQGASKSTNSREYQEKASIDTHLRKKATKSMKPGILSSGVHPGPSSILNRRANIFSPVLEAPSDNYASRGYRECGITFESAHTLESHYKCSSGLPYKKVFDSLQMKESMAPPNVVKVMLSKKQYILSRLDDTGTIDSLRAIFGHILDSGVTDTELVEFCETITPFLLFYNRPHLYNVLSEFHKKFSFKVTNLGSKAKPIHFYQIAVCQLMFLELAKCSNVPNTFKCELETTIVKNVASFFELLSVCQKSTVLSGVSYLSNAYEILATIIRLIEGSERLWAILDKKSLEASAFFILVKLFPVRQEKWNLLRIEDRYECMIDVLKIVNYCLCEMNWSVSSELILLFHFLYRKKRFENFPEEEIMSKQNHVITSYRQDFPCKTIFNSYLTILRSTNLKSSFVEKIVPISEVSQNDSLSVMINRMNLLISLAGNSSLNLEKRIEQLVRPILADENLELKDQKSLQTICDSILNCEICLFEINILKRHAFRSKGITLCFKSLIFNREYLVDNWTSFLERLGIILGIHSHSYVDVLKELYSCFLLMTQKKCFHSGIIILMRLYMDNLNMLGPEWVEANIFQCLKKKVSESTSWIDCYCKVAQFLITKQVISWWSFFMYNNVQESIATKIYFHYKILQLCDSHSFDLIKRPLFSLAAEQMLKNETPLFASFVRQLLHREKETIAEYGHLRTEAGKLHLMKRLFSTLNKLSYKDLLLKSIAHIRLYYQNKDISVSFVKPLIEYLNTNLVDLMKNSHDFLFLKRELQISDEETDKSSFRDVFNSQHDPLLQACYVEEGLIHACVMKEDVGVYMEKLTSLFTFSSFSNPFSFFVSLIEAHLVPTGGTELIHKKTNLAIYYLKLLNDIVVERFLQVTIEEFLELCKLHKTLCNKAPASIFKKHTSDKRFLHESMRFQLNILSIADGFWEFKILLKQSKNFLAGDSLIRDNSVIETTLSSKIDEIIRESSISCFESRYQSNFKEQNELESILQEFVIQRDI